MIECGRYNWRRAEGKGDTVRVKGRQEGGGKLVTRRELRRTAVTEVTTAEVAVGGGRGAGSPASGAMVWRSWRDVVEGHDVEEDTQ